MKTTFDIGRMWQVMKADLLMNKKALLSLLIGLTFGYAIWLFFQFVMNDIPINGATAGSSVGLVLSLTFIVTGTHIFSNMKTKQQRTAFLMLPANNLEKFASRALTTFFGMIVIPLLALMGADVIRYVFHFVLGMGGSGSVFLSMISFLAEVKWMSDFVYILILLIIWAQSVYVLGATFFSRHQWLFTTAVMFVLTILYSIVMAKIVREIDWDVYTVNGKALEIWAIIILVALVCFNYWASYRIFCRMQVINNKWLNV